MVDNFTLEQVKEHNYIVIDNNVYNFLEFEKKHPGGSRVLEFFRGKNATDKFYNIDKHTEQIKKSLIHFKIGELHS